MISLRYHAVSIAAVFLALAVGVFLGASGLSDRVLSAVSTTRDDLGTQVDQLTVQRDSLLASQASADQFAARIGPSVVKGLLPGQTVALVTIGATPADRDAVAALIGPARADQLRELTAQLLPSGAQLPAASDPGSLAGGLLSSVVALRDGRAQADPGQIQAVVSGLASAGFVTPGPVPAPANLVMVVTGSTFSGPDAGDAAAVPARMATELDRGAKGAVLVGRTGSAAATGAVGVARADRTATAGLSTVDDIDTGSGRVAAVLALREQLDGKAGAYGSGPKADASVPA